MSEKPPFNPEDLNSEIQPENITEVEKITSEHLIKKSGFLDLERLAELRNKFGTALKNLKQGNYDEEDSESYYAALAETEGAFTEAATIILNTIEKGDNPKNTNLLFFNLKKFLQDASYYPEDYPSLESIYDRIIQNFSKIEACAKDGGMEPMESMVQIAKSGSDEQKMQATGFLVRQLPNIEKYLKSPKITDTELVSKVCIELLGESSEPTKERIKTLIYDLICDSNKHITRNGLELLSNLFNYKKASQKITDVIAYKILFAVLRQLGIHEKEAYEWTEDWAKHLNTRALFVRENLRAVLELESKEPGITTFLSKKYGITAFGRYPVEMLIEQKAKSENKDQPYGIILYPKDDWNGAFHEDIFVFKFLREQMNDDPNLKDFLIRVYECGSKKDIAKALIDLEKNYRGHHKISFAIIGGHGSKDSINFGGGDSVRTKLYSKDFHRSRVQRTGDFFEPEATVILVSCSTGQNEGIGQTLSEKMGMKVIAPNTPTNISRITPKWENGKIDFDVEYSDKSSTAVYKSRSMAKLEQSSPPSSSSESH